MKYAVVIEGEPVCGRCGGVAWWEEEKSLTWLDADKRIVCRNCVVPSEEIEHGEEILRGLEEQADALRRVWLGADYGKVTQENHERIRARCGEPPAELRALLDQANDLEERIDDMRFVADSDERLLHHQMTGEWLP